MFCEGLNPCQICEGLNHVNLRGVAPFKGPVKLLQLSDTFSIDLTRYQSNFRVLGGVAHAKGHVKRKLILYFLKNNLFKIRIKCLISFYLTYFKLRFN